MRAQQGDHIVLAGEQVGQPARDGEIIEVRGEDGGPPYVVRWSDGREGTFFPGPSAVVEPSGEHRQEPAPHEPRAVREWQIRVSIFETADDTRARVALVTDSTDRTDASGTSHRSPRDPNVPRIGEEVAVARALRHLADRLLDKATHDVEVTTGEHDVDIRPD